jgi:hypothetical protein
MSNVAKDEAELIDKMAARRQRGCQTICPRSNQYCPCREPSVNALAAIRAAGWAVVPVEPTEEMIRATDSRNESFLWTDDEITKWEWAAMLAAAPGVKP